MSNSSYQIKVMDDVLKIGFNPHYPAHGDRLVLDASTRLKELITNGELGGGALLKIDGPASVAVSYVIAHKVAHLYGAIAIFDPRLGKKGTKSYIVCISHSPDYQVGQLIETPEPQIHPESNLKVVLCGFPQTGKSCLRQGLVSAIKAIEGAPYPYVITACPDGEGSWFSETAQHNPELAKQLKDEYKGEFTQDFAQSRAKWIRDAKNPLNLIDAGGLMSEENRLIMSQATHGIILAKNETQMSQWQKFCQELELPVLAMVESNFLGTADQIKSYSPVLIGSVHHLERGEDLSQRPLIMALAQLLVNLVQQ